MTRTVGEAAIILPGTSVVAAHDDRPLMGRDVVCFSNDWDGDPLSKTHLMRLVARDNRVLWVNSIGYRTPTASRRDLGRAWSKLRRGLAPVRQVEPNLHVLDPFAVPFYGPRGRAWNRRLLRFRVLGAMRRLGFQRPISWSFLPGAAVVAGHLGEETVIYHGVDEFTAFAGVPSRDLADLEADIMTRADLVLVSAERLLRSKARHNPRTYLIRHGVDFEHFRRALDPATVVPDEIAHLPRPVVGYFGLLAEDWIDLPLLERLADHLAIRGGSLVLIGRSTMDLSSLANRSNVLLTGRRPYADLPAFSKGFDAAIIPFPISEVTLHANPLKAREYLAAGLPVVSTAIPEVEVLGLCRIGRDPEEFCRQVDAALVDPGPSRDRSEAVRSESWAARLDEIRRHLASLVGGKT